MKNAKYYCKSWLISLCAALLLCGLAVTVYAQETVKTSHAYSFGQTVTFSLALSPGAGAAESTLYLIINDGFAKGYAVALQDNQSFYQRDLHEFPFPPFAEITYWWEFEDSQGRTQTTEETTFLYEDNRFQWRTLERNGIIVHWVSGDDALMMRALDTALASRDQIQTTLQTVTNDTLILYIYPSTLDLQSALLLTGREWVGGQAYPDIGVILLSVSPTVEAALKMDRDIPHELTHKILYDLVGSQGYDTLPIWLVEGLASLFERNPDPAYELALQTADQEGTLFSLEQLCYPFPDERERAILAYAQSQSFVSYIQQTHGWSRLRSLIEAYADGLSCSSGMERALGDDFPTLEREWRTWLRQKHLSQEQSNLWVTVTIVLRDMAPWLILMGMLLAPLGMLFAEARRRLSHIT